MFKKCQNEKSVKKKISIHYLTNCFKSYCSARLYEIVSCFMSNTQTVVQSSNSKIAKPVLRLFSKNTVELQSHLHFF